MAKILKKKEKEKKKKIFIIRFRDLGLVRFRDLGFVKFMPCRMSKICGRWGGLPPRSLLPMP